MKIARVLTKEGIKYCNYMGETYYLIDGDIYGQYTVTDRVVEIDKLLVPVQPSKIICIGVNYAEHAKEMGRELRQVPAVFIKPSTCLLEHNGNIVYPSIATLVHYEGELAIVMGRKAHKVSADRALEYVLGYTCANDVTERKIQRSDFQWTRGKGFDTFCPVGPYIATDVDSSNLSISTYVNDVAVQAGNTADLIYNVPDLIEFISQWTTLLPGDIILTGTPAGVGELRVGDKVEVKIEQIGSLINTVVQDIE
ncbi:MAG: fumarylacetoacetate hydrolase family protein [Clostridia bacterium]|nr:fumarylacetoacetate hydrolase family protein [Clostridia bacterium]MDD3832105.1 fumarylacetoacetate hydrolase family protein [Clostridia bacterium]